MAIKANKPWESREAVWLERSFNILNSCEQSAASGLSLRQTAVYAYLCLKWLWFADCDKLQAQNDTLDDTGALRRVNFFSGQCPLSPNTLQAVLESVTGRTFASCGLGMAPNGSPQGMYEAIIGRVLCLLEDFMAGNKINYSTLKSEISSKLTGSNSQEAHVLLSIVKDCEDNTQAEDFFKCWAEIGVLDCVYQEANQGAFELPDKCVLTVSNEQ